MEGDLKKRALSIFGQSKDRIILIRILGITRYLGFFPHLDRRIGESYFECRAFHNLYSSVGGGASGGVLVFYIINSAVVVVMMMVVVAICQLRCHMVHSSFSTISMQNSFHHGHCRCRCQFSRTFTLLLAIQVLLLLIMLWVKLSLELVHIFLIFNMCRL
jgi:hypothetical protein